MSRFGEGLRAWVGPRGLPALILGLALAAPVLASKPWAGIGRTATPDEIKAWDIDVRADFKGLPPGSGSVAKGQDIWEEKCASCHGTFGESNEVFSPVVGGTTREDIRRGRVANLVRPDYPQRTTLMKLSQLSTLWDYINRAMPWNAPKSLSPDEVYAVTAYILNLGDIVPADFVLSDKNIAQVQGWLPNRHGKVVHLALWSVKGKPDVQGDACMRDCPVGQQPRSELPDFARNSHGNLAEQNRTVGAFRGADTTRPATREAFRVVAPPGPIADAAQAQARSPSALARDAACMACHAVDRKMVGPALREVAQRYRADDAARGHLATKIRKGGQGVWGAIPMPGNDRLSEVEINTLVDWILAGAR